MQKEKSTEIKAAKQLKAVMAQYFVELGEATRTGNKKIAWCSSVGPAELAIATGFLVYFPENHAAILGANRSAMDYIPIANAHGYSPEICSYLTSDIGAYLKGETPLTQAFGLERVPKPDIVLYNTNQCRDVYDWMNFYAREYNVPIAGINTPRDQPEVRDDVVKACTVQLKEIVPVLESISGKAFDVDRFREVLACSLECSNLWEETLDIARHIPSPATFFDHCIHMGPAVVLRGRKTAVDYYKLLLQEMKDRVEAGIAAVEGERHRFYWDGMPIWGKLRSLSNLFSELKCSVVASSYCNSWVFSEFDPSDPFKSMARAYASIFIGQDDNFKERYIAQKKVDFAIDGIIYHDSKTCPNNTNTHYGLPERLKQRLNIPYLIINADLNDLRCYSEEQTRTNIEAFVEQLEEAL
ncbi:MAG: 2-hydroxyacyl-CoA dehydratase [Deltaproteobacteria bacterium]|nr:2-hydroxyacyl-CoA dehydratase [Deltaproteobacteria bacterium]